MSAPVSFDYVVVGGGTAGLVIATRLAEDSNVSVGVIEAGEDQSSRPDVLIPGTVLPPPDSVQLLTRLLEGLAAMHLRGPSDMDWKMYTTPQPGAKGRSLWLPRGKVVGGCGTTNIVALGKGNIAEYDAFETLGATGWNWKNLIPYFKKSETFTITEEQSADTGIKFNPEMHGSSGPIHRTLSRWSSNILKPLIDGFASVGVPLNTEYYDGYSGGVYPMQLSVHPEHCVRSSAASEYYGPNKHKSNLTLITGAEATRILLKTDESSGEIIASGIEYSKSGELLTVSANKEVILTLGTMKTPQLLELSGIGDKKILEAHNIPVVLDLPGVGNNYQDHYTSAFTAEIDPKYESMDMMMDPQQAALEFQLYQEKKQGRLTSNGPGLYSFISAQTYMSEESVEEITAKADKIADASSNPTFKAQSEWLKRANIPDLEFATFNGYMPTGTTMPEPGKHYVSWLLAAAHPFSRGTVHINSTDPQAQPEIDPHMFEEDIDVQILAEGLKFARKLIKSDVLSTVVKGEISPGKDIKSDEQLQDYVRSTGMTVYHPIGTASMLPKEDGGVVDANVKVYGTKNLRVADASIIPVHIASHPHTTIYAMAEKAADIIKSAA
ncbi:alcohol oxidase [Armillaria borealis]|uniref:Alcohol oxidase n=1 Tax=Armillaria borealis TaxID=47425 RepID=A0AA39K3R6_9AGAR|nr:alcohol oxidase [Armillaria borealis]